LTAKLLERFKRQLAAVELVPSGGGCFEVEIDSDLIYSKLKEGDFPDEDQIVGQVAQRLKG
jgi:selenoprotein W-related protein